MRTTLILLVSVLLLTGCETKEEVKDDIKKLKTERKELYGFNTGMRNQLGLYQREIDELKSQKDILERYARGENPRFIITLELRQSRFSLDIDSHIKDSMNKITFDIPVDREFYESVKVGDNIVDEFRSGSFLMKGSFSSWKMRVKHKKIING